MTELATNQQVADRIRRGFEYDEHRFNEGDGVALLDGKIVAVANNLDEALARLRAIEPDPGRGMLFEVRPPVVDVVR